MQTYHIQIILPWNLLLHSWSFIGNNASLRNAQSTNIAKRCVAMRSVTSKKSFALSLYTAQIDQRLIARNPLIKEPFINHCLELCPSIQNKIHNKYPPPNASGVIKSVGTSSMVLNKNKIRYDERSWGCELSKSSIESNNCRSFKVGFDPGDKERRFLVDPSVGFPRLWIPNYHSLYLTALDKRRGWGVTSLLISTRPDLDVHDGRHCARN